MKRGGDESNKNVSKILGILATISLVLSGSSTLSLAGPFLDVAKQTGVEIMRDGNAWIWKMHGGVPKPQGPLTARQSRNRRECLKCLKYP